jgi:dipeptidyl aminopeptidase/acylaminoacyl peptidase
VIWYGIFDLTPVAAQPPIKQMLGCGAAVCSQVLLQQASPATYVKRGGPPFLLIQGSDDKVVSPEQSRNFEHLLKTVGVPVTLTLLPGVGHSFVGPTLEATRAASLEALKQTFEFFDGTVGLHSR